MKALALTILTFFACLILIDLFTGYEFNPAQARPLVSTQKSALPVVTVFAPTGTAISAEAASDQRASSVPTVIAGVSAEKSEFQNVPVSSGVVSAPLAAVAGAAPVQVSVAAMSGASASANEAAPVNVVEATPTAVAVADEAASAVAAAPQVAEAPVVRSGAAAPLSPQLQTFAENMKNGQAGQVVGVFVQDQFALPVVQQPDGQSNFVSTDNNTVTQFSSAGAYGAVGLLAHNFLSGRLFFNLQPGQDVFVVYGDGQVEDYRIDQIQRYQALDPSNPYSYFLDASDSSAKAITAGALFNRIYAHPDQVVLQTCIDANGDSSWGRLFVTAEKVK